MEQYLNKGIKEIMTLFPETTAVLNSFDIGCAACSVGTCLLKDIVNIHDLSAEQEQQLYAALGKIFYPGKNFEMPPSSKKTESVPAGKSYSPPVKTLVDEHVLIMRLVALVPEITTALDVNTDEGKTLVRECVDFIRNYADRFHHAKEEDILFRYFDESMDMLKVMYDDHTRARGYVKAALEAVDKADSPAAAAHLMNYAELLAGHIKREDEILYPWMDRNLSTRQVGEMFAKFSALDNDFAASAIHYRAWIDKMENKFNPQGE